MKFFSELTGELFNSEKELIAAEAEVKKAEAKKLEVERAKKAERATKAKEVEKALKDCNEAQAKAIKLLKEFTRDYGYFHMSYSTNDAEKNPVFSNEDNFFNLLTSFLQ